MKIHLLDGTYELFRGFYGPPPRQAPDGQEVGATVALLQSLLSLLREPDVTHLAVAFDHVVESFRNDLFEGYKTGEGIPPKLYDQFSLADDALASAVTRFQDEPTVNQIVICSPDKDLAQLVNKERIVCWDRRREIVYDEAAVLEKYGVAPASIPDWLALVGDTADGIPGIPAWGAKSSATLLARYRQLENIPLELESWDIKVRGAKRLHDNFLAQREQAFLYRQLTRLRLDVPLTEKLETLMWPGPEAHFVEFCARLGAPKLMSRVPVKE